MPRQSPRLSNLPVAFDLNGEPVQRQSPRLYQRPAQQAQQVNMDDEGGEDEGGEDAEEEEEEEEDEEDEEWLPEEGEEGEARFLPASLGDEDEFFTMRSVDMRYDVDGFAGAVSAAQMTSADWSELPGMPDRLGVAGVGVWDATRRLLFPSDTSALALIANPDRSQGMGIAVALNKWNYGYSQVGTTITLDDDTQLLITAEVVESGLDQLQFLLALDGGSPEEQVFSLVRNDFKKGSVWLQHEPIAVCKFLDAAREIGLSLYIFDIAHKAPLNRIKV